MDRKELGLLSLGIALSAIVAISIIYPSAFQPAMSKALCEDSDGYWNECGSACLGEPPGAICPAVCVPTCECLSSIQCPTGYHCKVSEGKGACRLP